MRILTNAHIYTLNPLQPFVNALAIEGGKIIAAGDAETLLTLTSAQIEIENMGGKYILPGFCDAHIHLLEYGRSLSKINCETDTRQECLERIRSKCERSQPGEWILGHGWNHNIWPEGLGNASLLDEISQQHPIYLSAKSLHLSWVNSAALNLAGITNETPDPNGGRIERDMSSKPTGILYESASRLVENIIPEPGLEKNIADIQTAQTNLLSYGITSVFDFDTWDCYLALKIMEERGCLHLQVSKGIPRQKLQEIINAGFCSGMGSDQLRIGLLKFFIDGALGSQTAAMLQPYQGTQSSGMLLMEADELLEIGKQAVSYGINLAVHAIGDRANRVALDGYEKLRDFEKMNNLTPGRHRIEHVQLIQPSDQVRMSTLNIIASMQPIHAASDRDMAEQYWGKRCQNAYAWKSLDKAGVNIIFGSDAPVENPNPFWGLFAALTRQQLNENDKSSWHNEQCLTLEQALSAYTIGTGFISGIEDHAGTLAIGHSADLFILEQDIFTLQSEQMIKMRPSLVMQKGEWVRF